MSDTHPNLETPEATPAVDAALGQGWLMADEVFRHLGRVGIVRRADQRAHKPVTRFHGILMEIAAVLRLRSWQEAGLCDLLDDAEVTSALGAMDESVARLTTDPQASTQEPGLPPLMDKVFTIWDKYLASSGLEELNADVLLDVTPADEEHLLAELADLLWQHRQTGPQRTGD